MLGLPLSSYLLIVFSVPATHVDSMLDAIVQAGGGKFGNYTHAASLIKVTGCFMPQNGSQPFIGIHYELEHVEEVEIKTVCTAETLEAVVEEIKRVHPYEETLIEIHPVYALGLKLKKEVA